MARWHIQLLGDLGFRASASGAGREPITRFRWQKVGSLLARLAWKPGERVSRDTLMALLWPDEPIEKGRENLRAALASLRRQLEPPDVSPGTILVTHGRSHISLNPEAVETDVALFELAVRQGRYSDALALYKGQLLPDTYEDWVFAERERLEELAGNTRQKDEDRVSPATKPSQPSSESVSPRSPDVRLPFRLTHFQGRKEEMVRVTEMLRRERLVTVTGAGGTGKTRFAVEVSEAMVPDFTSICFIPLADLTNAASLAGHIADRMELVTTPRIESLDALAAVLNQRATPVLLTLDNFEHLTVEEQGPLFVLELLERVPSLSCLVTSRHRLGIQGEREFPLLPLSVPPVDIAPEHLLEYPAVSLFVDRAQSVRPDFQVTPRNAETIARLVEHLEGIPLALELAASWMKSFSVSRILEDIARRSILVSRGKQPHPSRQKSLQATLDYSLFLLTPEMRRLLLRLSVFRGGCTADAAAEVCEEPNAALLLTQLRERSLLFSEEVAGEVRFRMLEVLRQYVAEQLSEEEALSLAYEHFNWYLRLASEARPHLYGPGQPQWVAKVKSEHANMNAALLWCQKQPDSIKSEIRFSLALHPYWSLVGYVREGRRCLNSILQRQSTVSSPTLLAAAKHTAALLARVDGDFAEAESLSQSAVALFCEEQDYQGMARALNGLGLACFDTAQTRDDYIRAGKYHEESLALWKMLEDNQGVAAALNNLGNIARCLGDYSLAKILLERALEIRLELGCVGVTGLSFHNMGKLSAELGEHPVARAYYREALRIFLSIDSLRDISAVLRSVVCLAVTGKDIELAIWVFRFSEAIRELLGSRFSGQVIDEIILSNLETCFCRERCYSGMTREPEMTLEQILEYL